MMQISIPKDFANPSLEGNVDLRPLVVGVAHVFIDQVFYNEYLHSSEYNWDLHLLTQISAGNDKTSI